MKREKRKERADLEAVVPSARDEDVFVLGMIFEGENSFSVTLHVAFESRRLRVVTFVLSHELERGRGDVVMLDDITRWR